MKIPKVKTVNMLKQIDEDEAERIISEILDYGKSKAILLMINSPGGDLDPAIGVQSIISMSKIPVVALNIGTASSCALDIFCTAQHRLSVPSGSFLFHFCYLTNGPGEIDVNDVKNFSETLIEGTKKPFNFYSDRCNKTWRDLSKMTNGDHRFNSKKAIEDWGIVEKIVEDCDDIKQYIKDNVL